ncbi:MAG TPA: cytochrome c biogenesis protein CcsA [Pseudobdellovibrionaceae bacterium]|jgi:ABC-type transport system involved in cytochrome c biogenesis permease subunit
MKLTLVLALEIFFTAAVYAQHEGMNPKVESATPEKAMMDLKIQGEQIQKDPIRSLMVHQNGRLKPFDTFAQESILFLNGSYKRTGLHPVQTYLALMTSSTAPYVELVEVRDPELRVQMGFMKSKRFMSLADLESSNISSLTEPLFKKQEENSKSLTSAEKTVLETFNQAMLLQAVIRGDHLARAADFSFLKGTHGEEMAASEVQAALREYIQCLMSSECSQGIKAEALLAVSGKQETPDMFKHYFEKTKAEIFYNDFRPFFWASLFYILLGVLFSLSFIRNKIGTKWLSLLLVLPLSLHILGLGLRVYITQFAPVTNMYGTMIWVSLGVTVFSTLLFILYKNAYVLCAALICSGLILMLTEQIPMILSPDLDPIVAVLRSNFWLSTHVTTITISYAAFTVAAVLGNIALFRVWIHKENDAFFKEYSHYAYRMIQLGCFLLTVGIILGGVWADYSWGRFWGWDPKETWALIADVGFLAILHARIAGWLKPFTLLAFSPVAYLLVIMAWYGVNFILAAGLHSYGFSSGGALVVAIYVVVQAVVLALGFWRYFSLKKVAA